MRKIKKINSNLENTRKDPKKAMKLETKGYNKCSGQEVQR